MPLGPEDITLTGKTLTGGTISGSTLTGVNVVDAATIAGVRITTALIAPNTNDGVALGTSAFKFADLFLALGGVIQFSTEATSITHSASVLTIAASTIVTNGVSQSTAAIYPTTSEGVSLGTSTNRWGGVFTSSGINFPAAVDASADANTLDDYEEGTFTPTWTPATTGSFTIGYNAATTGTYTKIGNNVYVQGFVQVTSLTSGTGTGQMGISGLPFASGSAPHQGCINMVNPTSGLRAPRQAIVSTGVAIARAYVGPVATTGISSALNLADLTTGANQFNFSGSYSV